MISMNKKIIIWVIIVTVMSFAFTNMVFAEQTCTPSNPSISISPSSQTGSSGSTLSYTIYLKNNDNSYCNNTDFKLSCGTQYPNLNCFLVSSGGTEVTSMIDGNIPPGYEWQRTVKVNSTYGLASDTYPFTVTIDDGAFNKIVTKSAIVTGYYNIQGPILITKENRSAIVGYVLYISATSSSSYEWKLGSYDKYYLENKVGSVSCSSSGSCTYTFSFMPLKEGQTLIELNKVNKNDNSTIETKQIYLTITSTTTCTDSDDGINYFTKGCVSVCSYIGQTVGCGLACDSCSGNILTEGYCEGNQSKTVNYECPAGYVCKDGACVKSEGICTTHADCSQACDNLGIDFHWSGTGSNYKSWNGTCPSNVYGCMTGKCCIGQCKYTTTNDCYCQQTNKVDIYGNVCPAGTACGSDCECHPIGVINKTEKYMTVDLNEVFFINETTTGQYDWRLFDIDNNFYYAEYLNAHGFKECDASGQTCKYIEQFQAIKEGKAVIVLQKINKNDLSVVEEKYFYITIKEMFTNAYLNKPFELSFTAPSSHYTKAKIIDYNEMIIGLGGIGQNSAMIFVKLPDSTPINMEIKIGESKDVFGVNIKLLNTTFDYEGRYPARANFIVTLQTSDFSFNVYSNNYYNLPKNTVYIKAILSGSTIFDFQNAKVEINIKDPQGNIIELPVEKLGTVTTECVESSTTNSYICPVTNHYSFYAEYLVPENATLGLYSINAKATLGSIEKDAYSSFKVLYEHTQSFVEVSIKQEKQTTIIGKEVSYDVTVTDSHPSTKCSINETELPGKCGNQIYNYLISVDDMPYHTVFPTVVSVPAGGSKTFELKVFPSPVKTAEGITTAVTTTSSATEHRTVGITAEAIATESQTISNAPLPVREAVFKFSVKASLREDSTVSDSAMGILYVRFIEAIKPPAFPEQEKINIKLKKGWNLVTTPTQGIEFTQGTCIGEKPLAFVFLSDKQRYVTLEEALSLLGKEGTLNYLGTHSLWIYSYDDCNLGFKVESYSTYSNMKLEKGWNLLGVTQDMIGETLSIIKGDCNFERIYSWNPDKQEWDGKSENDLIESLGNGIAVKVVEDCNLNQNMIQPPPFPGE